MKAFGLSVVLLGLAGCFSIDRARLSDGGEHIVVSNFGWRLFNCVPIVCGNANPNPKCGIVVFRDDVTFDKIQARFAKVAAGREIICPVYDVDDSLFFRLPFTEIPVPIPYLWTYKKISLSGTVK